jgi:hypothetical protein
MYNKDGSAGIKEMEFKKKRWIYMAAAMLLGLCSESDMPGVFSKNLYWKTLGGR